MSQALSIRGIAKSFGDNHVLRDVNLALPEGSTTALIGPSASGKSVLLKCAAGLLRLDAGQIDVLGQQDVHDWQALRPRIGVLFQRNALFDSMRVWQNVAFPLMRRGTVAKAARAEAFELLEQVGLAARAGEGWPKDLSGGMQKRAALARALAGSPDLLLLDDPTAGLDPVLASSVEQLIRYSVNRHNATALIITAEVHRLAERFDHVAVLDQGHVIWSGPADKLDDSVHPLLQAA
jgi:phospholipid/cholesterol/gamma-HCH transport system ATP-binding protein